MSTNFDTMFAALDAPFTNFKKNDGPIVWQAKDLLVHQDYVLKVPVMPGSTIKYSFTTTIGDICFSTEFVATGQSKEVLVQPLRVPSDIETITGTFKAVREGTFSMIFDNKFSWFNPKLLNYQVFLHQVFFECFQC